MGHIPGFSANRCIRLFEEALGERALTEYTGFPFLLSDPGPKTGRRSRLRVDAYFPRHRLVVEYKGRQHYEDVNFMNRRPGRAERCSRYQDLRRELLPQHGYRYIEIRFDEPLERALIERKLREVGIQTD